MAVVTDWLPGRGFPSWPEARLSFTKQAEDTFAVRSVRHHDGRGLQEGILFFYETCDSLRTAAHRPFIEPRCSTVSRVPSLREAACAALDTLCAPWFQLLWAIGSGWAHVIGWFSEYRTGKAERIPKINDWRD
jgi:hypothetical protein